MDTTTLGYLEVLTNGEDGLAPCVMLSIEKRASYGTDTTLLQRYLFDAPEEIIRFCGSHGVKVSKLAAVFATSGVGAAGMAETILACAEQGLPALHVRGPSGVTEYVQTITQTLSNPRGMRMLVAEAKPQQQDGLCYEDSYVRIYAVDPAHAVPSTPTMADFQAEHDVSQAFPLPPPPPPLADGARRRAEDLAPGRAAKRRRAATAGIPSVVGYRVELKASESRGAFVLPANADGWCLPPGSDHHVLRLGRRPLTTAGQQAPAVPASASSADRHIWIETEGRRRGLWKSRERICRWHALAGEMVAQPPDGQEERRSGSSDQVLRVYLRPAQGGIEAGRDEGIRASAPDMQIPTAAATGDCGASEGEAEEEWDVIQRETVAECEAWGMQDSLLAANRLLAKVGPARRGSAEDPQFLFLGTGSAKPTSRRGQSAILVRAGAFSALLDCGGGTWAQLVRLLGEAEALRIVDQLQLVWISHHHADHCAGLPTILAQRSRPGLRVVASPGVQRFWRSALSLSGCGRGGPMAVPYLSTHRAFAIPVNEEGWPLSLRSVPVDHCPEAYGIVLRTSACRIVYSGDCRPSSQLVAAAVEEGAAGWIEDPRDGNAGDSADPDADNGGHPPPLWLIHEATFNPDEQKHAERTRHSTSAEALDIAHRMGADGLVLTHFSQRYPSISLESRAAAESSPKTEDVGEETAPLCDGQVGKINVSIAFDGLLLAASQTRHFGKLHGLLETYWNKRHDTYQKTNQSSKLREPRQPAAGACLPRKMFHQKSASGQPSAEEAAAPALITPLILSPQSKDEKQDPVGKRPRNEKPKTLAERLRAFYLRVNPEKCDDADRVAMLFAGKEAMLNDKLQARYDGKDMHTEGFYGGSSSSSASSSASSPSRRRRCKDVPKGDAKHEAKGSTNGAVQPPPAPPSFAGLPCKARISPAAASSPPLLHDDPLAPRQVLPPPPPRLRRGSNTEGDGATLEHSQSAEGMATLARAVPPTRARADLPPSPPSSAQRRNDTTAEVPPAVAVCPAPADATAAPRETSKATEEVEQDGALEIPTPTGIELLSAPAPPVPVTSTPRFAAEAASIMGESPAGISISESVAAGAAAAADARRLAVRELEDRVRRFYLQHNPEKVDDATKVAKMFFGKEAYLNERLRDRYSGLDLSSVPKGALPAEAASVEKGGMEAAAGDKDAPAAQPRRAPQTTDNPQGNKQSAEHVFFQDSSSEG